MGQQTGLLATKQRWNVRRNVQASSSTPPTATTTTAASSAIDGQRTINNTLMYQQTGLLATKQRWNVRRSVQASSSSTPTTATTTTAASSVINGPNSSRATSTNNSSGAAAAANISANSSPGAFRISGGGIPNDIVASNSASAVFTSASTTPNITIPVVAHLVEDDSRQVSSLGRDLQQMREENERLRQRQEEALQQRLEEERNNIPIAIGLPVKEEERHPQTRRTRMIIFLAAIVVIIIVASVTASNLIRDNKGPSGSTTSDGLVTSPQSSPATNRPSQQMATTPSPTITISQPMNKPSIRPSTQAYGVRQLFRQQFLIPPEEDEEFFNVAEDNVVTFLFAFYTPRYVMDPERSENITTTCEFTDQNTFYCEIGPCLFFNNTTGEPLEGFVLEVDYVCEWTSVNYPVLGLPENFTNYMNTNQAGVLQDMQTLDVNVTAVGFVRRASVITLAPTLSP